MSHDEFRARRGAAVKAAATKRYPSPAARRIDEPMSDGTPLNDWQRAAIAAWHRRNLAPRVLRYGLLDVHCVPRGVYCAACRTPSVLFPADNLDGKDNRGYCICPRCSLANISQQEAT